MAETMLRDTLRLAEDDIGAGRPADALTRCHHMLAHYPEMLEARRVLGEAYLALRKTREAFQAFDRVLVSDPENTLAYCGRALISQQLGDYESSLDCYYQACELSLGNRQLRLEFRRLAALANQPDFILSRVGLARLYMRGDLLAHAIREWEQVLQSDPERVDARLGLAEALWRDDQLAKAAEQCKLILHIIPSCLKALLFLGEIAYRTGTIPEANQYLEQARRLDPDGRLARELFADALMIDKALGDFILAEPALIPVMEERLTEERTLETSASQSTLSALQALQREVHLATGTLSPMEEHAETFADETFTFSFLETASASENSGPPLREGESLEEMLAALIERPTPEAPPTPAPPPAPVEEAPADPAMNRLQELLDSFAQSSSIQTLASQPSTPLNGGGPRRTTSAPLKPKSADAATSGFAEAISWLDTVKRQQGEPSVTPPAATSAEHATLQGMSQPGTAEDDFAARRPRRTGEWVEEEESEASWLRWLQAQGARSVDASQESEEEGPFAALLRPGDQPEQQRTVLWEAPDEAFARSLWPHDTVPQRAVRLTPGAAGNAERSASASGENVEELASISSVSLRPLTLEELDRTFSVSGLTRLEGTLAALRGENPGDSLEQEMPEGPLFTIAEDNYSARLELAERLRKSGNLEEALGHYRAIMRGAPEFIDKVITGLLAASQEAPGQATVYRLLGDAYTRRGNYMEALEAYNKGLAASRGH
jgi:tetratricopeptide (TPR) repeat protein